MRRALFVTCVAVLAGPCPAAAQTPFRFADAVALFAYDSVPFDLTDTIISRNDGVVVHDITYASPRGGKVTAYLVVPEGKGPFAGIVFGHWGNGTRTEFLPEAELYARVGAISVLIDYPWVRPAPWRRNAAAGLDQPEVDRDVYIAAGVDLRRAIDLLRSRGDLDPARIAYVGHSYGAQWGAILSALDRRLTTAVLVGGVGRSADIFLESDDPDFVGLRERTPPEVLRRYLDVLDVLDGIHWVAHAAPTPLLMQFARYDRYFDVASMERYAAAASEPKMVLWYDTGHELNDVQALVDRAAWLARYTGIGPIAPHLRRVLDTPAPKP